VSGIAVRSNLRLRQDKSAPMDAFGLKKTPPVKLLADDGLAEAICDWHGVAGEGNGELPV